MQIAATKASHRFTTRDTTCVAILIAYFLYFALPARHGGFRDDEMMNLWTYWYLGAFQSVLGLAKFWTSYYRPGGALYYLGSAYEYMYPPNHRLAADALERSSSIEGAWQKPAQDLLAKVKKAQGQ